MSANDPLCLDGGCTLIEAPAHHRSLAAALATARSTLTIDLSGVAQADVTLLQLLLAARTSAARQARSLVVSAWSPAAATVVSRAGLCPADFTTSLPPQG